MDNDAGLGFLEQSNTKALSGFCAILVLLHHLGEQGLPVLRFFGGTGYLPVGFFLFLSGFGLTCSYETQPGYLRKLAWLRIPRILIPFILANIIYLPVKLALGDYAGLFSLKALFGGGAIVSYSWYVICILYCYASFFVAFRFFRKPLLAVAACIAVWIAAMIASGAGIHRYNATLCFLLGCYVGRNRVKAEVMMKRIENITGGGCYLFTIAAGYRQRLSAGHGIQIRQGCHHHGGVPALCYDADGVGVPGGFSKPALSAPWAGEF